MAHWIAMDNPYQGLAASVVTSNPIDFRDALACTFSWYTTAGTTSAHTLQASNSSASIDAIPAASWVNYVAYGTGTPAVVGVDDRFRYGRIIRTVSGSSVVQEFSKLIEG